MSNKYLTTLACLSLSAQAIAATTDTWIGASDIWGVTSNWTGGVPVNGDDLVFPTTATTFTVNYSTLSSTANAFPSIEFDGDYIFSVPGVTSTIPEIILTGSPAVLSNTVTNASDLTVKSLFSITSDLNINLLSNSNVTFSGLVICGLNTITLSGASSIVTFTNTHNSSSILANFVVGETVSLQFVNGDALGSGTGRITLDEDSTLELLARVTSTPSISNPITLEASSDQNFLIFNELSSNIVFTVNSNISGTNTNLFLDTNPNSGTSFTGTYIFNGTNTYSGATFVSDQYTILQINGDSSIGGTGTTGNLGLTSGATVVAGAASTSLTTHPITLSPGTETINAQSNTFTISSMISGSNTLLALTGTSSGVINLEGANTYMGDTSVTVGTVGVSGTSPFGSTGSVTLATGTVLQAVGDSSFSNDIDTSAGATFNSQTFDLTIDGIVSGTGFLTIDGSSPGLITLGGVNTYEGDTVIGSGASLSISSDDNLGAGGNIETAGTLITTATITDMRLITLTGPCAWSPAVGTTLTLMGLLQGGFSVTMNGAGTLFLEDVANTYSGGTVINSGTVQVAFDASLGDLAAGVSLGTATLATTATFPSARTITLTGAGTISPAASTILTLSTGIGSGANSLTMGGAGQLILTGSSTYTGGTTISSGTLSLSGTGSLASTGAVTVNGSGVFDISGLTTSSTTIGDLISASTTSSVTLGANNLKFGTSTPMTTFAGVVSGVGGSLTKQGSGIFIVTGANTYSGGTTIDAGKFSLSGAGSISTTGAVAVNGASTFDISGITATGITIGDFSGTGGLATLGSKSLTFGTSNSTAFTNAISGAGGSLIMQGTGTFTLSGANSYTGGTTINAGTVSLSGTGSLASTGAVAVGASSTFDISGLTNGGTTIGDLSSSSTTSAVTLGANALTEGTANSTTFAGVISGTGGSFIKQGTGTLTLTNANTYTGGTTINAGQLSISTSTGSLAPTGSVTINGSGIFDISGVTTGTFTIGDLISGSSSSSVTLGSNTLTAGTADSTTFAGSISGTGGVTKASSGTLTLSGNSTFIGDMTITQGQLTVNGIINAPTIVSVGGTLAGTGTIDNSITISGTLRPGNSVGTLNSSGPVTFNPSCTYAVEVNPKTADLLNVAPGIVSILGGAVSVIPDPGSYSVNNSYPIIKAAGGITGRFNSVALDPVPMLTPLLIYTPNTVFLVLEHAPFAPLIPSGNASGVARCLDTVTPGTGSDISNIVDALFFVTGAGQLQKALLQLQPALFKGFSLAQENMTIRLRTTLTRHADFYHQNKYLRDAMWNGEESERTWTIWADAIGDIMHQRGYSGAPGLTTRGGGGIIGADLQMFDDFYLGFSGAYTYDGIEWHRKAGYGDVQSAYGTVYATYSMRHFYVNASLTGAYNRYFGNRSIHFSTFETIDRRARSTHGGGEGAAYLGFGGLFQISDYSISPYISGDYIYLHENSFTEHGAQSLDLHVHQNNSSYLRGEAGLAANVYLHHNDKIQWLPSVKMGVVREWRFLSPHYLANLKGLPCTFMVTGLRPDRTIYTPGASLTAILCDERLGITFGYDGEFGRHYIDNNLDFQLSYSF